MGASVAQRMGARKVSEKEYPGLYRSVRVRTAFYLDFPFHRVVELFLKVEEKLRRLGIAEKEDLFVVVDQGEDGYQSFSKRFFKFS